MRTRSTLTICILLGLSTLTAVHQADAQVLATGGTARENAANAGSRSPGAEGGIVANGLARYQDSRERAGILEITEQEEETGIWEQALADSITIVFDQLNQAIIMFYNLLLARAGLPPAIPASIMSDLSDTGGTDGTGDGTIDLGGLDLGGLDLGDLVGGFSGSTRKSFDED